MMSLSAPFRKFLGTPTAQQARRRLVLDEMPAAVYAIGDVHGCYALLHRLEKTIISDAKTIPGKKLIVYLGDIIDRGEQVLRVVEHVLSDPPPGFERLCLCGNHEFLMKSFVGDPSKNHQWLEFGGMQTLHSYGLEIPHRFNQREFGMKISIDIPEAHREFLADLPVSLELPEYFLVHAGIDPEKSLSEQTEADMLWIRGRFLTSNHPMEKTIVHGHTPQESVGVSAQKICVDTGAYASGKLSAVRLQAGIPPKILEVKHGV